MAKNQEAANPFEVEEQKSGGGWDLKLADEGYYYMVGMVGMHDIGLQDGGDYDDSSQMMWSIELLEEHFVDLDEDDAEVEIEEIYREYKGEQQPETKFIWKNAFIGEKPDQQIKKDLKAFSNKVNKKGTNSWNWLATLGMKALMKVELNKNGNPTKYTFHRIDAAVKKEVRDIEAEISSMSVTTGKVYVGDLEMIPKFVLEKMSECLDVEGTDAEAIIDERLEEIAEESDDKPKKDDKKASRKTEKEDKPAKKSKKKAPKPEPEEEEEEEEEVETEEEEEVVEEKPKKKSAKKKPAKKKEDPKPATESDEDEDDDFDF